MGKRVDYSDLVDSIYNGDNAKASFLLGEIIPRLVEYLKVTMSAKHNCARECVQQALVNVVEQIRKKNIRKPNYIFSYLMRACRNEYISYSQTKDRYTSGDSTFEHMAEPATQIENLIDEERQKLLEECISELDHDSKKFICYFLDNPESTTREVSRVFSLTEANVRTKKSRLIRQLHGMYQVKSAEIMV